MSSSLLPRLFRFFSSPQASLLWLSLLALAVVVILASGQLSPRHGLRGAYYTNSEWLGEPQLTRIDSTINLNSNDLRGEFYDKTFSIRWEGYLYAPTSGNYSLILESDGGIQLWLDDRLLIHEAKHPVEPSQASIELAAGLHPLAVSYFQDVSDNPQARIYLFWQRPDRIEEPIPAAYLYPARPRLEEISTSEQWRMARQAAVSGWWLALLGLAMWGLTRIQWSALATKEFGVPLAIFLVAFMLRIIYLLQVKDVDPYFSNLPLGMDQLGYEYQARGLERGHWPGDQPFYFHPLYPFFLHSVHRLIGEGLLAVRFVQAILGSLACILIYSIGRVLFNRWVGTIAGALAAAYGIFIFFDAALLPDPIILFLNIAVLWALLVFAPGRGLRGMALTGVLFGLSTLARASVLLFLPMIPIWMLLDRRDTIRRSLVHFGTLVVVVVLTISPAIWWNYRTSGQFLLTAGEGGVTLFIGNNRHASGVFEYSASFEPAHTRVNLGETSWFYEVASFVRDQPGQWLQLTLRKLGLFWGNREIPNNVDYYGEGLVYSSLLRGLPLDFRAVALLGLAGIYLSLREWRRCSVLYFFVFSQVLAAVLFFVLARFRTPVVAPLMIFGGYSLYWLVLRLRDRNWGALARRGIPAGLISAAFLFGADYLASAYPTKPLSARAEVPSPVDSDRVRFGDQILLLGWEPLPTRIAPGDFLKITLYWETLSSMDSDYSLFIHLVTPHGQALTQGDTVLGKARYPEYPSSQWQPGQIIRETYFVYLPQSVPNPTRAEIRIGVYLLSTLERLPAITGSGEWLPENALSLGRVLITSS